jgi:uncharacterized protein YkwD
MKRELQQHTRNAKIAIATGLTVTLFATAATCIASDKKQAAPAATRQYVFSRTRQQTYSSLLGATTVPATVQVSGANRNGLYITKPEPGALSENMGLTAGCVLLTIDNRVVDSSSQADRYINEHPAGSLTFSYTPYCAGPPQVVQKTIQFSGPDPVQPSGPIPSTSSSSPSSVISIEELERYGVDLINSSRSQDGKGRVEMNAALTRLARTYAQYQVRHPETYVFLNGRSPHVDLEGHNPGDRARIAGINEYPHENLGMETRGALSDKQLIDTQHNRMMSEPPNEHNHRANILNPDSRYVGVGIARDGNRIYLVEEFTSERP